MGVESVGTSRDSAALAGCAVCDRGASRTLNDRAACAAFTGCGAGGADSAGAAFEAGGVLEAAGMM
jgi:hypothetical protein